MADLQLANHNHHNLDPSEVLLRTYDDHMQAGHDARQSYNHAKQMHPVEFQIVNDRARNHGHQNGVPGERHNSRYRLILRGHHTNPQNGVCVGHSRCATCVVLKYTTHNFLHNVPLQIQIRVGGSGGLIKRAFQQGERILQDQVLTMYNAALELSIATRFPVRLYAYLPRHVGQRAVDYVYLGIWRVVSGRILLTPLELDCYEFRMRFLAENQVPAILQQLFLLGEVGGPEGFLQEGPEEGPEEEEENQEEQLLLEWHVVEDANVEPLEVQEQHSPVIQSMILKQPSMLQGGLSAYQLEGLRWMLSLFDKNLNGILVDETRLDRIVQIISLIAYLMENENVTGPHLIVTPKALLSDWMTGFATWAPRVATVCYDGCFEERKAPRDACLGEFNVLLTHHDMITTEKTFLKQISWYYMILDEGDQLKTPIESGYKMRRTVLLTRNPTLYSLRELWSLLYFVVPEIFSSVENFEVWFNALFAGHFETSLIRHLQHVIRPFILTRTKEEVEHQKCDISAGQKVYYQQVTDAGRVGPSTAQCGREMLEDVMLKGSSSLGRDLLSERKINSLAGRSDEERARQASNRAVMTESEVPDKENLPPPLTWKIHKRKRSRVVYLCVMTDVGRVGPSTAQCGREMLEDVMLKGSSSLGRDVLSEKKINSLAGRSDEERARQASNRAVMTESEVPDKENLPPPLTWKIHKRKRSRVAYLCVMTESEVPDKENLPPPLTWKIHKRKRSRVAYL